MAPPTKRKFATFFVLATAFVCCVDRVHSLALRLSMSFLSLVIIHCSPLGRSLLGGGAEGRTLAWRAD